jgi:hypothetical protein
MFPEAESSSIQVDMMFNVCLTWVANCSQSNRRQSAQSLDAFFGEQGRDAFKEELLYVMKKKRTSSKQGG